MPARGSDNTLVTYGTLVNEVLAAAKMLQARGISAEVLKLPSIKPLDVRTVAASMRKTGRLLVAEESVCIGCVGKGAVGVAPCSRSGRACAAVQSRRPLYSPRRGAGAVPPGGVGRKNL